MNTKDPCIYRLIMMLRQGGSLVCSSACTPEEIAIASAEGRFTVDGDGFGYVYRPPSKKPLSQKEPSGT